jgi:hypothetical protein
MLSTESQRCSSIASGWDRRSFPVFFLYSVKATSRIDSRCMDGASAWEEKDMVQLKQLDGKVVSDDSSLARVCAS